MSLMPSSTMTSFTPVWFRTSRSSRVSALCPNWLELNWRAFPEMPSSTTDSGRPAFRSRAARKFGYRWSWSVEDRNPSVIESPSATTRLSDEFTTSTPSTNSQEPIDVVKAPAPTSAVWLPEPAGDRNDVETATACSVAGPLLPSTATLTARSCAAATVNETGSLNTSLPAPKVTDGAPPNRSWCTVPETTLAPDARTATLAAENVTARFPNTFESRTRTWLPATLGWTTSRTVRFVSPFSASDEVLSSIGDAAQVPTKPPGPAAEAAGAERTVRPAPRRAAATGSHREALAIRSAP